MMPGVTLVPEERKQPVDRHREVAIDLERAVRSAAIDAVSAPRTLRHVFNRQRLARRERPMLDRGGAARVHGGRDDAIEAGAGEHETPPLCRPARPGRTRAREKARPPD